MAIGNSSTEVPFSLVCQTKDKISHHTKIKTFPETVFMDNSENIFGIAIYFQF